MKLKPQDFRLLHCGKDFTIENLFFFAVFANNKTFCCSFSAEETQTNEPDEIMEALSRSDIGPITFRMSAIFLRHVSI